MITYLRQVSQSFLTYFILACLTLGLSACGGGTSGSSSSSDSTTPQPASIQLLVSSPTLASDGTATVTMTAIVKGAGNTAMSGQTVAFSANSGVVAVTSATTDAGGIATATIGTGSDPTNRTITLSATTGSLTATNTVVVSGTTLSISGSSSLVLSNTSSYDIFLKDSGNNPIAGSTLAVTSSAGNPLNNSAPVTDSTGRATVILTGTIGGTDTLTVSALGTTATQTISISTTNFVFTTPAVGTEVPISTPQTITVHYDINGVNQAGTTINFSSTRGTVSASTAVTNGSGDATITVSSTTAGPATVAASVTAGPAVQRSIEFVATTANSITIQPSPATVGTTEQSTITATVRDATNNLVKNKVVQFNIIADTSNGSLSPSTAITNSSGQATAVFTAGSSTTAQNGVSISATVQGTVVTATTTLTVSQKALFITLGTGNSVSEPNATTYQLPYSIFVADAAGNPVSGASVTFTIQPISYAKGNMGTFGAVTAGYWRPSTPSVCTNEDINNNGIFDLGTDNDTNNNGTLEPGIVANVTPSITTDSTGAGNINITYAQDHAYWTYIKLIARATVSGSESTTSVNITLPGVDTDYNTSSVTPPGYFSPYGVNNCATAN